MDMVWVYVISLVIFVATALGATTIGYQLGLRRFQERLATKDEVIERLKGLTHPIHWHWWTGREDDRNDRKEFLVGVVAYNERDAKMKLDQQRIPLLDKARASGVKEIGTHVLVAYSREDIHVQAI